MHRTLDFIPLNMSTIAVVYLLLLLINQGSHIPYPAFANKTVQILLNFIHLQKKNSIIQTKKKLAVNRSRLL